MNYHIFQVLGTALGLGLLIGLQRERTESKIAGIRTFALITLSGAISGLLALQFGGWIIAAGVLALATLLISANAIQLHDPAYHIDPGQTTEVAALLMFGIGAYLAIGDLAVGVVLGGVATVLLHAKAPLHGIVQKMGESDIRAIMRFVVISLVILPLLPNRTYGPYAVLNPYDIWLMVVLIVGIGLLGYVGYKLFKERGGTLLAGILGGLISSTATTISYARRSKDVPRASHLAALAIMLASTVAYFRIIAELSIVAPGSINFLAPPLVLMFLLMAVIATGMYFFPRNNDDHIPEQSNPSELKSAFIFGILYALITFAIAAAKDYFGQGGLYVIAAISGLTDVDAITLSTGRMVEGNRLDIATGWHVVLIASLANLVFKGGTVAMLANRALFKRIAFIFSLSIFGGLILLWVWPSR